jgi:hypothetical protein
MIEVMKLIQQRQSSRVPFDETLKNPGRDLTVVLKDSLHRNRFDVAYRSERPK